LETALATALEELPGSAYIVARPCLVLHANAAGHIDLQSRRAATEESIVEALAGGGKNCRFVVRDLGQPGAELWFLLVSRMSNRVPKRLVEVSALWSLTKRQTTVLEHVVRGSSNKAIAAQLGCSGRAVEFHLTAILFEGERGESGRADHPLL